MKRIYLITILFLSLSLTSLAQIIGGRDNSEMTPKVAEATKLTGGGFTGDVNHMTGEFSASIPLGSVSTPAGLGFSLVLNHSSSFAFSLNQPMTAGIPYGDGWSPNIPTISMETDVFRKYTNTVLKQDGGTANPTNSDLRFNDGTEYSSADEGDLYWFSPSINIPGVASGRAIFKYVDKDDGNAMVFVLNKFETPVEIRFYGNIWVVKIADGTRYEFQTHLANYRAPSNQRVPFYDQYSADNDGYDLGSGANPLRQIVDSNKYLGYADGVHNVIEPKKSYSVWHCDLISNQNTPLQGIRFDYQKFGKFNYFKEFNQDGYQRVRTHLFNAPTNTDFFAYTDVFLQQVYSYVMESPLDIVELDYNTVRPVAGGISQDLILDPNGAGVTRLDSLYSYKTVESWGEGTNNFSNWTRYKHSKKAHPLGTSVNQTNPYLHSDNKYYRDENLSGSELGFDHGYLESGRLLAGQHLYPGDIYEIKTKISRPDGTSLSNGNGTIDIAVKTAKSDISIYNDNGAIITNSQNETKRGTEIFSTFNSALKWQMGYQQSVLETSNLFMMPNIPGSYQGFNIQVGPGNSDIDFGALDSDPYYATNQFINAGQINALKAYPFASFQRPMKSTAIIPHNFGTGHPWSMMIPAYNEMALQSSNPLVGSPGQPSELYDTWWSTQAGTGSSLDHPNIPTKFNNDVKLKKVELIRYSKNAYMLKGVRVYKVNGNYAQTSDSIVGRKLVSQKELQYDFKGEHYVRNYDYDYLSAGLPPSSYPVLQQEAHDRLIILLSEVQEVPLNGELFANNFNLPNVADTGKVLTTYLGYAKVLDSPIFGTTQYDPEKPWQGLTQYCLTSYVDHLGGITKVEYYPLGLPGGSRYTTNYQRRKELYVQPTALGGKKSWTAHMAVKYLAKNDETNVLANTSILGLSGLKTWKYEYSTDSMIVNPKKFTLPKEHFRSDFFNRNESAFKKTKVYSPKLADGTQTMVEYEYHGAVGVIDTNTFSIVAPSLDNYLYYGKLKRQRSYEVPVSGSPILHEETIIDYGYTLAFKNAHERPNPWRDKLGFESLYSNSYEYEDIYKSEPLTIEHTSGGNTTTYVGENAYSFISSQGLTGSGADRELSKFLEFKFYDELVANNPAYLFDAYFVKKTSETKRTYEKFLSKAGTSVTPTPIVYDDKDPNPFGTGITNPVVYDAIRDNPLMAMLNEPDEDLLNTLYAASPLADTVLEAVLDASIESQAKASVLGAQGGLSNDLWKKVIDERGKFTTDQLRLIMLPQAYFADETLDYLSGELGSKDNYTFAEEMYLKNDYLSEASVTTLTLPTSKFPAETFAKVISEQSQLSDTTLRNIVTSINLKDINLASAMRDQVLSDAVFDAILAETKYSVNSITTLIEQTPAFPSDAILLNVMNHSPAFKDAEILRIFAVINRPISTPIANALNAKYRNVASQILGQAYSGNTLDQYCANPEVETRDYLETKTEYEYYEADYTGKAVGKAYEMLLGHRSKATDPSPYPMNRPTTNLINAGSVGAFSITSLKLKHEPSWQVFAVQTSSKHLPDAYNREEYFYLFDLQNRYDRYWYNYDLESGDYLVGRYDIFPSLFSADTTAFSTNWHATYADQNHPKLPKFDGMERSRTYGNRSIAFQKTVISKNTRDDDALIRSEYFDYDRRWTFTDLPVGISEVPYQGDTCVPAPPTDCDDLFDCTDCYAFRYINDEAMQALVPLGYCAYKQPFPDGGYGTFICPMGSNYQAYAPTSITLYCNVGIDPTDTMQINSPVSLPTQKALPLATALSKTLQLRSVTVQVDTLDHSTSQEFTGIRMDDKNQYIAEFTLGSEADADANGFTAPYAMIYPYDHLTVRTILERNRYLQPQLEENQIGLRTRYDYNKATMVWNTNANCTNPQLAYQYNYLSRINEDIGLPTKITVGVGRTDSLLTQYDYTEVGLVEKVTEPSGKYNEYSFDDYHRLTSIQENGNRLLSNVEYFNWDHDATKTFNERIEDNYVKTELYNSDPSVGSNALDREIRKAFIDPLGRAHSVVTGYSASTLNHVNVYSGTVEYDNWGRTFKTYKNYRKDTTSATSVRPRISTTADVTVPFAQTKFEDNPKGRALRASNYGVDVNGIHAVKTNYALVNNIYASCELSLSTTELEKIMGPGATTNYRFFRTEVLDQDNKRSVEYINGIGQKVATLKYHENGKVVTLFVYDSYGNLQEVINPAKQNNTFEYNILGQLVKETSVDAGTKRYMYNKQGLVSITLDEQGLLNKVGSDTVPFYRVFNYDVYGRPTAVGRSNGVTYVNNDEYTPLHYQTTFVGQSQGVPVGGNTSPTARYFDYTYSNASSQDWLVSYDVWAFDPSVGGGGSYVVKTISALNSTSNFFTSFMEKAWTYGLGSAVGKVTQTESYSNDDVNRLVQRVTFTYDVNDNVATQTVEFHPTVSLSTNPVDKLTSVIEYPAYNYRNSLLEEKVDVNNDGTIDYHLFMEYDQLNRLSAIYAASGQVANKNAATLLVGYTHDDANGVILTKKHYIEDNALAALVEQINYEYDERDRLTKIKSSLMDYQLFYDAQTPQYTFGGLQLVNYDHNWNGNINGTLMQYSLENQQYIVNPVSNFDKPTLYGYSYDKINRLVKADATVENLFSSNSAQLAESHQIGDLSVAYDRIGNIQSLHRTLKNTAQGGAYTMMDHFNYVYGQGNNRLEKVIGLSGAITRNYTYDDNGNLLTDDYRQMTSTEYGRTSYAFKINKGTDVIDYLYSNDDLRIFKRITDEEGNTSDDYYLMDATGKTIAIQTTSAGVASWNYFASGAERECKLTPTDNSVQFRQGEVSFYEYDHLGNTRVNYTPIYKPGETILKKQINHVICYTPYGKMLREEVLNKERFLTTQHERDQETGLDYRGARYYDSDVARFLSLDPLAKDFAAWSPYNYVMGNPVSFVDPDGKQPLHYEYLVTTGLEIFFFALKRKNGSVEGAFLLLAQAVMESGWDGSTYNYNLFGIMADRGEPSKGSTAHGSVKDYTDLGKYRGSLEDYFSRLETHWPDMIDVFSQENITADDIDRALHTGEYLPTKEQRHSGIYAYNFDLDEDGTNDYGTRMVEMVESVRSRMIGALDYGISAIRSFIIDAQNYLNATHGVISIERRTELKLQMRAAQFREKYFEKSLEIINSNQNE